LRRWRRDRDEHMAARFFAVPGAPPRS
jgi:hypothetical protein